MKDIFLSRPNWIPAEFNDGINNLYSFLTSLELNPRTVGQSDYPNESPLSGVTSLMKKCKGTIVLGIPQIRITSGFIKEKEITSPIMLGTEWNHIEAALAYSMMHPILIIHDERVNRGVFERGATNSFLYNVEMDDPAWVLKKEISGAIHSWKSSLLD